MDDLRESSRILIENAISLAYLSRGAIPYETVMTMCAAERKIAFNYIHEHIKNEIKARPESPNY